MIHHQGYLEFDIQKKVLANIAIQKQRNMHKDWNRYLPFKGLGS